LVAAAHIYEQRSGRKHSSNDISYQGGCYTGVRSAALLEVYGIQ